jgi:hypothetical protein
LGRPLATESEKRFLIWKTHAHLQSTPDFAG